MIVWSDGESVIEHPAMCRCGFCLLDYSRGEAVKFEVGWIIRWKSEKWISNFPKMYNHKGIWRPSPTKKFSYIKKYDIMLRIRPEEGIEDVRVPSNQKV